MWICFRAQGAITHCDAYNLFWSPAFAPHRQTVDAAITGEDYLMSFVLAREFGSALRLTALFVPPREMCDVDCELGRVSLGLRSSSRRPTVLLSLFDSLGDAFAMSPTPPPPVMLLDDNRCDRRCYGERHKRVSYLIDRGPGHNNPPARRISMNNYRTFCRSCPPALRPAGQQCPAPADGWLTEIRATRGESGGWLVATEDIVTTDQQKLVRRARKDFPVEVVGARSGKRE